MHARPLVCAALVSPLAVSMWAKTAATGTIRGEVAGSDRVALPGTHGRCRACILRRETVVGASMPVRGGGADVTDLVRGTMILAR